MREYQYHIEYILGDLTKVVFEDGYTPSQQGASITEALQNLREFRAQQPPHDLSVLRRRYKPVQSVESEQVEEQPKQKKSKRNKGSENNEQE